MAASPPKHRKRQHTLASNGPPPLKVKKQNDAAGVLPLPSPSSSDDSSRSRAAAPSGSAVVGYVKFGNKVRINLGLVSSGSEFRDLKRRLVSELERVRKLRRKIDGDGGKQSAFGGGSAYRNGGKSATRVNSEVSCVGPLTGEDEGRKNVKGASPKVKESGVAKFSELMVKKCDELLAKLMRHQYGWVFNAPVDAKKLKLHDYYTIIKNPMDLSTVKTRLTKSWYKSPKEFAEDVRLTFTNALTYNEKGQDVHHMAEVLLQLFDNLWAEVRQEIRKPSHTSKKPAHGSNDLRPKTSKIEESANLKKPLVKDRPKKPMKFEEKQNLSTNLQLLPSDQLEVVVQIIRKRNPGLFQQENEIEVDIDCFEDETLWELHEFVSSYMKSAKKNSIEVNNEEMQQTYLKSGNGQQPKNSKSERMTRLNASNSPGGSFSKDSGSSSSSEH